MHRITETNAPPANARRIMAAAPVNSEFLGMRMKGEENVKPITTNVKIEHIDASA